MNRLLLLMLCCGALSQTAHAQKFIENQQINKINEVENHVLSVPMSRAGEQFTYRMQSDNYRLLDGEWDFCHFVTPDKMKEELSSATFRPIRVPCSWQMAGYGIPHYLNAAYPFEADPPRIKGENGNPVGVYRRQLSIPENWEGRECFLWFEGVSSAYEVYIDGRFVGYSEDSNTPSEFDITEFLTPGSESSLEVRVFRWCDGSYLECQDTWLFSGIHRNVFLYAAPDVHLKDYRVVADASGQGRGRLSVDYKLANYRRLTTGDYCLDMELKHPSGESVWSRSCPFSVNYDAEVEGNIDADLSGLEYWSHEQPNLYHLQFTLRKADGTVLEHQLSEVGFRRLEIRGRKIFLNDKELIIKGVNRVEHNTFYGKYIPLERMEQEVRLLKESHINCVRTSHAPAHPYFYTLCDRYGILVIDEANVESHGMWYAENSLAKDPSWERSHVERAVDMVQRDKNHPCVVIWSLGNEAGCGVNMMAMRRAILKIDTTRPVTYHFFDEHPVTDIYMGGVYRNGKAGNLFGRYHEVSDLYHISKMDLKIPFVVNEYAHSMGNALGNLKEYVEAFEKCDGISGGCIWDWIDQGIIRQKSTGKYGLAIADREAAMEGIHRPDSDYEIIYGGDFGEKRTAGNFCLNGITQSDLRPTPKLEEVRRVYQNLDFSDWKGDEGSFLLKNKYMFTDAAEFDYSWELLRDGRIVKRGGFEVASLEGGASRRIRVDVGDGWQKGAGEYLLNLTARARRPLLDLPAGRVVARHQFRLSEYDFPRADRMGRSAAWRQLPDGEGWQAGNVTLSFDLSSGDVLSISKGGVRVAERVTPNFWRAPTDNDKRIRKQWESAGLPTLKARVQQISVEDGALVVRRVCHNDSQQNLFTLTERYTLLKGGVLHLESEVEAATGLRYLAYVGYACALPASVSHADWYGAGPFSSYADRSCAAQIGRYRLPVEELFENYPKPQENGNRSQVRSVRFDQGRRTLLTLSADRPFNFAISDYTDADLAAARHAGELHRSSFRVLRFGGWNAPLGNSSAGPEALDQYRLKDGVYRIGFFMEF